MRKAVFLDRDGVLNRAVVREGRPYPPASLDELELLPGVKEACRALREAGYLLIVVTNQPDISRGTQTREAVDAMNARLRRDLELDDVRVCPHQDGDQCACRKPEPGMLADAARAWDINPAQSFMVGDRWRDVEAGRRAGVRTVFIDYQYQEKQPSHANYAVQNLAEAADWILGRKAEPTEALQSMNVPSNVKIFADGADLATMRKLAADPLIQGFTTNPTLMRQAGVAEYEVFAKDVLASVSGRPVSFEVFADELDAMERQALTIAAWGPNVYVKIPVTNTWGVSTAPVLRSLATQGVNVNVTALLTLAQVEACAEALAHARAACISVFAGRIADTGRDPVPVMTAAVEYLRRYPQLELIWASPRELLNILQADSIGCHIITVTPELLKKLPLIGKDLDQYSLETVRMFHDDGQKAGLSLETRETARK